MSWFSSLFTGQNTNLNNDIGATGQIASNQSGQGQKNQNTASTFWNSIVGGDATKQMQTLSPEISAAKTSVAQDTKTNSQFGTRSGGTAASNASAQDKVHGYITNLIGSLTGQSASDLASLGTSQVGTGLSAYNQNAQLSEEQTQDWANSIFGKGITSAVSDAESFGLTKLAGLGQNKKPKDDQNHGNASGITWNGGGTSDADPSAPFGTQW